MREHVGFLRVSSAVVKVAAWIFLFFGVIGGAVIARGFVSDYPRWTGLLFLSLYVFAFFFFYVIAKMADLLIKIINEIKK